MFLVRFVTQLGGIITTVVTLLIVVSYTYGVAKVSAQVAMDSHGNPIKQKALSLTLGVTPPKRGIPPVPISLAQCKEPEEKGNTFLEAFENMLGQREGEVE